MRRSILFLAIAATAAAWPSAASAQYVSQARGPVWDRFTLEPYAGRYFDNAGTAGSSFNDSGWMGGLRLGVALADRVRVVGDVGYAQVDGIGRIGTGAATTAFGSQTWLVTGGVEADLIPGDTRASLSLQGGRAWRDTRLQGPSGTSGTIDVATNTTSDVLVPGFAIRHRMAPRADVMIGVQDYIFVGADPVSHNWAVTAGISLR